MYIEGLEHEIILTIEITGQTPNSIYPVYPSKLLKHPPAGLNRSLVVNTAQDATH